MRPGRFTGKCRTEWVNKEWYRVVQTDPPFSYITSAGFVLEPPDGMWTDLGSVPCLLWPLLPRDEFLPGYIIHDFLYDEQMFSRQFSDYILREIIYTLTGGHSPSKEIIVYYGLRLCGGCAWCKGDNKEVAGQYIAYLARKGG